MSSLTPPDTYPAVVENRDGQGPAVVICEHASNAFPAEFGTLGLTEAERQAHIAWDPGALGLARGLARRLGAPLVHAPVSRLVYDCNRPPDAPGAMAAQSESYRIPGNAALSATARQRRTAAVYLPFHAGLCAVIAAALAAGRRPALITVHSFTPTWFGTPRAVELGVIREGAPGLAEVIAAIARRRTGLAVALDEPYSALDGVTHTLRLQAVPYGLDCAMLEIRNDLIATPEAEEAMSETLTPVLDEALAALARPAAEAG